MCGSFYRCVLLRQYARRRRHTVPVSVTCKPCARASQPTMVAISCTSCLVSLAFVDFERRRLSFARRQGWLETWTLDGTDEAMVDSLTDWGGSVQWLGGKFDIQTDSRWREEWCSSSTLVLFVATWSVETKQSVRSINNVCPDKVHDRRRWAGIASGATPRTAPTHVT